MENKYILYRNSDGYVENIIAWDGVSEWQVPENCSIEKIDENEYVGIAFTRKGKGEYVAPEIPYHPVTVEELIADLKKKLGLTEDEAKLLLGGN